MLGLIEDLTKVETTEKDAAKETGNLERNKITNEIRM